MPKKYCKIKEAHRRNNITGRDVWEVELECGRKCILPGRNKKPPTRMLCDCRSSTPTATQRDPKGKVE